MPANDDNQPESIILITGMVLRFITMFVIAPAVAGSLLASAPLHPPPVARSTITMRQVNDQDARVQESALSVALARAKSPRGGAAEVEELRRAFGFATAAGLRSDGDTMRAAQELLLSQEYAGSVGSAAQARMQQAAERQLSTALIRAKSPRAGRSEVTELKRALGAATAARLDGALVREAEELVAQGEPKASVAPSSSQVAAPKTDPRKMSQQKQWWEREWEGERND